MPADAGFRILFFCPLGRLSTAALLRFMWVVLNEEFMAGQLADDFPLTLTKSLRLIDLRNYQRHTFIKFNVLDIYS
jgi:hypothetical protein